MPRENDLEGVQDQGGKNGGQKHMPKPEPRSARSEPRPGQAPDQGIVRDERARSSRATKSALSSQPNRYDPTMNCREPCIRWFGTCLLPDLADGNAKVWCR